MNAADTTTRRAFSRGMAAAAGISLVATLNPASSLAHAPRSDQDKDANPMTSPADHSHDFDFQIGSWHVQHRRLRERLVNSQDWEEFAGECTMQPVLGGSGNVEDNLLHISTGTYRAVALRAYKAEDRTWAIWWLDGRDPHHLDVPVIGSFEGGVGRFYAEDELKGRPIRVRFEWSRTDTLSPRWEQAMSLDGGETWEINWTMDFTRVS